MSLSHENQPAIAVRGVSKSFKISIDGSSGIKQKILNIFRHKKGYRNFTPLNNISFEVQKGEFFGIVGRNGSGKSTLLKAIAGIYTPEKGHVKVNGTLVPFIELGVGFNAELTGRENIYLNGALLGFSRSEISAMYDEIVDFAELRDFMEERLKNYSSGMQVRLAFSIAIQAKGDILLLDEVLAVGDAAFQQKCFDYFEKIKREHRTIILVTHGMDSVKRFCDRALLLENGKIKTIGRPEEVADQYLIDNISPIGTSKSKLNKNVASDKVIYFDASINGNEFNRLESVRLTVEYRLSDSFDVMLGLSIIGDGRSVAEMNSFDSNLNNTPNKKHVATIDIPLSSFNPNRYSMNVSIFKKDNMEMLDYRLKIGEFIVKGKDESRGGVVYLDSHWDQ